MGWPQDEPRAEEPAAASCFRAAQTAAHQNVAAAASHSAAPPRLDRLPVRRRKHAPSSRRRRVELVEAVDPAQLLDRRRAIGGDVADILGIGGPLRRELGHLAG